MIYERFLGHLKQCGGCTGLRSIEKCRFAIPCAVAEVLARKGMISDSKDLVAGNGHADSDTWTSPSPGASENIPAGLGPCSTEY